MSERRPTRRMLSGREVADIMRLDVPASLATLDPEGFPRITPIWFLWDGENFRMTSVEGGSHLRDLAKDDRAAICLDTEEREATDGVRANRAVKARGSALLSEDADGEWTRWITLEYIKGAEGVKRAKIRTSIPQTVITMKPETVKGTATTNPASQSIQAEC